MQGLCGGEDRRSRVEEEGGTATGPAGDGSAAPLFTASATVVCAVLSGLAASGITTIKIIGVTAALSVAVDALLVRPLLVPAVMTLADSGNWWAPRGAAPDLATVRNSSSIDVPGPYHDATARHRGGATVGVRTDLPGRHWPRSNGPVRALACPLLPDLL